SSGAGRGAALLALAPLGLARGLGLGPRPGPGHALAAAAGPGCWAEAGRDGDGWPCAEGRSRPQDSRSAWPLEHAPAGRTGGVEAHHRRPSQAKGSQRATTPLGLAPASPTLGDQGALVLRHRAAHLEEQVGKWIGVHRAIDTRDPTAAL